MREVEMRRVWLTWLRLQPIRILPFHFPFSASPLVRCSRAATLSPRYPNTLGSTREDQRRDVKVKAKKARSNGVFS